MAQRDRFNKPVTSSLSDIIVKSEPEDDDIVMEVKPISVETVKSERDGPGPSSSGVTATASQGDRKRTIKTGSEHDSYPGLANVKKSRSEESHAIIVISDDDEDETNKKKLIKRLPPSYEAPSTSTQVKEEVTELATRADVTDLKQEIQALKQQQRRSQQKILKLELGFANIKKNVSNLMQSQVFRCPEHIPIECRDLRFNSKEERDTHTQLSHGFKLVTLDGKGNQPNQGGNWEQEFFYQCTHKFCCGEKIYQTNERFLAHRRQNTLVWH
ncbi:unnamed protein product [Orchesella dallaii]|uniref:Uncharacterized protein n=1 Tax=Orchesella dallaii TaxID=48710 RepID=A0ABP1QR78_9HEXA